MKDDICISLKGSILQAVVLAVYYLFNNWIQYVLHRDLLSCSYDNIINSTDKCFSVKIVDSDRIWSDVFYINAARTHIVGSSFDNRVVYYTDQHGKIDSFPAKIIISDVSYVDGSLVYTYSVHVRETKLPIEVSGVVFTNDQGDDVCG